MSENPCYEYKSKHNIVGHKKLTCACEFYIYSKYKNNNKNNKEKNIGNVIVVIDRSNYYYTITKII